MAAVISTFATTISATTVTVTHAGRPRAERGTVGVDDGKPTGEDEVRGAAYGPDPSAAPAGAA